MTRPGWPAVSQGEDARTEDLGVEVAELLGLSRAGQARSLNRLATLAVRQVPGCSAAHATLWHARELAGMAATHPEAAELAEAELAAAPGPLIAAVRTCESLSCGDTLTEGRWPEWAVGALRRGIRCYVYLVRELPPVTLVLGMLGVRPGALDAGSVPMAELLAGLGGATLSFGMAYGQARRTATQLLDSVAARAVTDQAKGILMHVLGCDADEALQHLRRQAQRRHIRVTEVAAQVIAAHSAGPGGSAAASG